MPLNAVVVLCTVTAGVVLDFLAPVGPLLAFFAGLVGLLWIAAVAVRLTSPSLVARAGRLAAFMGDPSLPPWRDRRLWLTGGLALALGAFAFASQHARAQGGVVASASPTVQDWQQGLGLLQRHLEGMTAEQRASNVLLQQGNANTSALRTGQDTQTSVLVDIRETLQGVPKNRMGLKATLWSEDLREARKLLDAGIKFTLIDTYQLAALGRTRAVDLLLERPQSVEREEKDCAALSDPNQQMRVGGKVVYNNAQQKVREAFCGGTAAKELDDLRARAHALEAQVAEAVAKPDPRRQQCEAYHFSQRAEYARDLKLSRNAATGTSRCGFEACSVDLRLAYFSGDPQRFAETVQEKCTETTASPALRALQADLASVRAAILAAGK